MKLVQMINHYSKAGLEAQIQYWPKQLDVEQVEKWLSIRGYTVPCLQESGKTQFKGHIFHGGIVGTSAAT